MRPHTLNHAIYGWKCHCSKLDIYESGCVMCGKFLDGPAADGDICGKRCFAKLLEAQRLAPEPNEAEYLAATNERGTT